MLALIPTGGGKSLTFQLPAAIEQSVTFVIMPLIALIEDNYSYVKDLGIPALTLTYLGQSKAEERRISDLYRQIENA